MYTQLHADDAVLYSRSRIYLQKATQTLENYPTENGLTINVTKTMKFGAGGPPASGDVFKLYGEPIEKVSHFCYLGVHLSQRGIAPNTHLVDRIQKAKLAFCTIPKPKELSLETALALYDLKIAPIASYGVQLIWDQLTQLQLFQLDKLKASYLERVLGVHRTSRNRLVYLLIGAPLMTKQLRENFQLNRTNAYSKNRASFERKFEEIDAEFLNTPAMTTNWWKEAGIRQRHKLTRGAIHGFHHELCKKTEFHEADENCTCELCGQPCTLYHLYKCIARDLYDWSKTDQS